MATCYMCDNEATSVEHAPPRCLFPRQRDLPSGVDLRNQLITVPACEEHNQQRSSNDEYLLYTLVINIASNEIAQNHFFAGITRGINNNPSLIRRFTRDGVPVITEDTKTGKVENSIAVNIEYDRFKESIDNLVRAIYFHHFNQKLLADITTIQSEFMLRTLDPEQAHINDMITEISRVSDLFFADSEYHGNNPEVFKYQIDEDEQERKMMRLHFYDNARITAVL